MLLLILSASDHANGLIVCICCRKRCFISNLSFKTSWQDLKDKFREVGNVVYANVTRDESGERSITPFVLQFCYSASDDDGVGVRSGLSAHQTC